MSKTLTDLVGRVAAAEGVAYDRCERRRSDQVPERLPTLYHYTDVGGLQGLLREGRIWASHAAYLNDCQELRYAETLAKARIERYLAEEDRLLVWRLLQYLAILLVDYTKVDRYVASFCASEDLLSQWRGYGGIVGYSLGFEAFGALRTRPVVEHASLVPVIYDEAIQVKRLDELITSYISSDVRGIGSAHDWFDSDILAVIESVPPAQDPIFDYQSDDELLWAARDLIHYTNLCLRDELQAEFVRFKHPGFQQEQEWRLVYTHLPRTLEIKFRGRKGYLVPFVELPMLRDGQQDGGFRLKSVMCGPAEYPEAAAQSVRMWLDSAPIWETNRDRKVEVKRSSTPYRAW